MSEASGLQDILKSLPSYNLSEFNTLLGLCFDSNGVPKKIETKSINMLNLHGKEEPGTEIPLREFTQKYISDATCSAGRFFSDSYSHNASSWSIVLPDGTKLNTQRYMGLATKTQGSLTGPYNYVRMIFFPCLAGADAMYFVYQETVKTADEYKVQIYKIPLTLVYNG